MEKPEFILCAAIHLKDGKNNIESGVIICGRRHGDCYGILRALLGDVDPDTLPAREDQGFLTSTNRYVDRKEGYLIAKANKQLLHDLHDESNPILISEDLY